MSKIDNCELVRVTHFINPYFFWIDRIADDNGFKNFTKKLQIHAENSPACVPEIGMVVAVQEEKDQIWKRAEVDTECDLEIIKNIYNVVLSSQQTGYKVWLIDEGRPTVIFKCPRKLSVKFREKETKVETAALHGIVPATKNFDFTKEAFEICRIREWSAASSTLICKLLQTEKNKIYFRTRQQLDNIVTGDLIIEFCEMNQINIAEYICEKNLAIEDENEFLIDLKESKEQIVRVKSPYFVSNSYPSSYSDSSPKNMCLQSVSKRIDLDENLHINRDNVKQCHSYEIPVDIKNVLEYKSPVSFKSSIRNSLGKSEKCKIKNSNELTECKETDNLMIEKISPEIVLNRTVGRGRKKSMRENNPCSNKNIEIIDGVCKENTELKVTKGRGIQIIKSSTKYKEIDYSTQFSKQGVLSNISLSTKRTNEKEPKIISSREITKDDDVSKNKSFGKNNSSDKKYVYEILNSDTLKINAVHDEQLIKKENVNKNDNPLEFEMNSKIFEKEQNKSKTIEVNKKKCIESNLYNEGLKRNADEEEKDFNLLSTEKCNEVLNKQIKNKVQKNNAPISLVSFGKLLLSEKRDQNKSKIKHCDLDKTQLNLKKQLDVTISENDQFEEQSTFFEEIKDKKQISELVNTSSDLEESLFDKGIDLLLSKKKKNHQLSTSLISKVSSNSNDSSTNLTEDSIITGLDGLAKNGNENQLNSSGNNNILEKQNDNVNKEFKWPMFNANKTENNVCSSIFPSGYNIFGHEKSFKNSITGKKKFLKNNSFNEDEDPIKIKLRETKQKTKYAQEKILQSRSHTEFHHRQPRLLIHSTMNITRIHSVDTAKFCPTVLNALHYLGVKQLNSVQAVTWNIILRGLNGIIVDTRHQHNVNDKYRIFTYLPPLCDNLINTDYSEFGTGYGPYALILCASRTAVKTIYEFATNLVYGCPKEKVPRIAFLLNRNTIITSCNLLITTPRCFLRKFQQGGTFAQVTDLKRLCHFVLNEADAISLRYSNELDKIFHICHSVLQKRCFGYNLQLLATAEEWTPALEKICAYTPVIPTIIIKPPVEAALYGKVNIALHFVNEEQKISKIKDVLEKKYTLFRTIIVCNTQEEIIHIYEYMEASGYKVNYIHNETQKVEIDRIIHNWEHTAAGAHWILLAMDEILSDVYISSAVWLIHYSLPHSWSHFSYRFFTLTENYPNLLSSNNKKNPPCQVHIFVDEKNTIQIPRIVNFLKRLKVEISSQIYQINEKVIYEREIDRAKCGVPLCHSLLSWGYCSSGLKCKHRHTIFSSYDETLLNISIGSTVKLQLLKLHDVVHFSARLFSSDGDQYTIVAMKMSQYLNKNRRLVSEVVLESIYAYDNDGMYQRCKILEIYKDNIKIKLIDDGDILTCKKFKLMHLSKELISIPPQAIDVYICGMKPVDDETEWDLSGNTYINNLLNKYGIEKPTSYLHGTVKLVLKGKIWIENVHLFEEFKMNATVINKLNISNILIQENFAVKNPNHMTTLYSLCKAGNIDLQMKIEDKEIKISKKNQKNIQMAHMDIEGKFEKVHFLSTGENNTFYLSFKKYDSILNHLTLDIKKKLSSIYQNQQDFSNGEICIAYLSVEKIYRVRIIGCDNESSLVDCWLLDEGYNLEIDKSNLWSAETWMLERLPAQAIYCRLFGVNCDSEKDLIAYEGSPDIWARCVKKDLDGIHCVLLQECGTSNCMINLQLAELNVENHIAMEEILESDFLIDDDSKSSKSDELKDDSEYDNSTDEIHDNNDVLEDIDIEFDEDDLNNFCRTFLKKENKVENKFDENKESTLKVFDRNSIKNIPPEDFTNKSLITDNLSLNINKPLEASKSNYIKNDFYTPTVLWYQTEKLIILKVQLVGVKICEINVNENIFHFSTNYNSTQYKLNLKLYNLVKSDHVFYEIKGLEVYIELIKSNEDEEWPRLLSSKQRCRYVKVDLSHEISDSEDDGRVKPCLQTIGKICDDNESVSSKDKYEVDYDFGSDDNSSDYASDDFAD